MGSTVAKAMLADGHDVSILDEDPEAIALLERGSQQSWEESGGMFTVGTAIEMDALIEAGIERADAMLAILDGPSVDDGTACEIGMFHALMQSDPSKKGIVADNSHHTVIDRVHVHDLREVDIRRERGGTLEAWPPARARTPAAWTS